MLLSAQILVVLQPLTQFSYFRQTETLSTELTVFSPPLCQMGSSLSPLATTAVSHGKYGICQGSI